MKKGQDKGTKQCSDWKISLRALSPRRFYGWSAVTLVCEVPKLMPQASVLNKPSSADSLEMIFSPDSPNPCLNSSPAFLAVHLWTERRMSKTYSKTDS